MHASSSAWIVQLAVVISMSPDGCGPLPVGPYDIPELVLRVDRVESGENVCLHFGRNDG
jgi:hypothetical protein